MSDLPLSTVLDRRKGPLYRQAAERLRRAIATGRLQVGAALPTEAELASGFGVSLITVRQALRDLEGEGLIRKRSAKTAIVTAPDEPMPISHDLNSFEDIVAATSEAKLEIDSYGPARSLEASNAFGLAHSTTPNVMRLHGRMLIGERPVTEITIFFPGLIGSRLTLADFDNVVVFRTVERRLGIRLSGARITISSELASKELAELLDYQVGAPVLTNRMLYFDADRVPVELTIARHRADSYELTYDLRR